MNKSSDSDIRKQMEVNGILLDKLISLKKAKDCTGSKQDEMKYNKCFEEALRKFDYIVELHASKYRKFSNYKDLSQEGKMGLMIALMKFDPKRSKNFFKVANWYIKTRIKRAANKHDVMKVPLNSPKEKILTRICDVPIMVDKDCRQDEVIEKIQFLEHIRSSIDHLTEEQAHVICLYYGIDTKRYCSTNKKTMSLFGISKKLKIPKENIVAILDAAHEILSKNIKSYIEEGE